MLRAFKNLSVCVYMYIYIYIIYIYLNVCVYIYIFRLILLMYRSKGKWNNTGRILKLIEIFLYYLTCCFPKDAFTKIIIKVIVVINFFLTTWFSFIQYQLTPCYGRILTSSHFSNPLLPISAVVCSHCFHSTRVHWGSALCKSLSRFWANSYNL